MHRGVGRQEQLDGSGLMGLELGGGPRGPQGPPWESGGTTGRADFRDGLEDAGVGVSAELSPS